MMDEAAIRRELDGLSSDIGCLEAALSGVRIGPWMSVPVMIALDTSRRVGEALRRRHRDLERVMEVE